MAFIQHYRSHSLTHCLIILRGLRASWRFYKSRCSNLHPQTPTTYSLGQCALHIALFNLDYIRRRRRVAISILISDRTRRFLSPLSHIRTMYALHLMSVKCLLDIVVIFPILVHFQLKQRNWKIVKHLERNLLLHWVGNPFLSRNGQSVCD